jgi:hypothetical protein
MAFADAYLAAGSPGLVRDGFSLPANSRGSKKKGQGTKDPFMIGLLMYNESALLRSEKALFPQLDRYLDAEDARAANEAAARFFSGEAPSTVAEFRAALGALRL